MKGRKLSSQKYGQRLEIASFLYDDEIDWSFMLEKKTPQEGRV